MENIVFIAIIIQCSIAKRRCSGFYCIQSFYDKNGTYISAKSTNLRDKEIYNKY